MGSGEGRTLAYWTLRSTFAKKVFWFNHSFYENLKNPKWPPGGLKMADGVWNGVQSQVIGRYDQLLLNKFFDPSTPSMRKGRDGEWRPNTVLWLVEKQKDGSWLLWGCTRSIHSFPLMYTSRRIQRYMSCPRTPHSLGDSHTPPPNPPNIS